MSTRSLTVKFDVAQARAASGKPASQADAQRHWLESVPASCRRAPPPPAAYLALALNAEAGL
eukprot:4475287-Pyramimonas_sp.AAC.1